LLPWVLWTTLANDKSSKGGQRNLQSEAKSYSCCG
jgi:hypothetical protein